MEKNQKQILGIFIPASIQSQIVRSKLTTTTRVLSCHYQCAGGLNPYYAWSSLKSNGPTEALRQCGWCHADSRELWHCDKCKELSGDINPPVCLSRNWVYSGKESTVEYGTLSSHTLEHSPLTVSLSFKNAFEKTHQKILQRKQEMSAFENPKQADL